MEAGGINGVKLRGYRGRMRFSSLLVVLANASDEMQGIFCGLTHRHTMKRSDRGVRTC